MVERQFQLTNASGLHARPAALFVETVQRFPGTDVFVRKGKREVNARSILSVLTLGAAMGCTVSIRCSGPQEVEAMEALGMLLAGGFGE